MKRTNSDGLQEYSRLAGFDDWLRKVDAIVIARTGFSVHDLPGCNFAEWYEDGIPVATAAYWWASTARSAHVAGWY